MASPWRRADIIQMCPMPAARQVHSSGEVARLGGASGTTVTHGIHGSPARPHRRRLLGHELRPLLAADQFEEILADQMPVLPPQFLADLLRLLHELLLAFFQV